MGNLSDEELDEILRSAKPKDIIRTLMEQGRLGHGSHDAFLKNDPQLKARREEARRRKEALALAKEEGYLEAMLALMPQTVKVSSSVAKLTEELTAKVQRGEELSKTEQMVWKRGMDAFDKNVDRRFGKATQRAKVDATNTNVAIDVADLVQQSQANQLPPPVDPDVIDASAITEADDE